MKSSLILLGRLALAAIFLPVLATAAQAGSHADANGCYTNRWFEPFVTDIVCTNPALGDPAEPNLPEGRAVTPREPPPHECPYPDKPDYESEVRDGMQQAQAEAQDKP